MKKYSNELKTLLPDEIKEAIKKKIDEAELLCSCEFKVVVAHKSMPIYMFNAIQILPAKSKAKICNHNVKINARIALGKFVSKKTQKQNGILLFVSLQERKVYMMAERSVSKILTQALIHYYITPLAEGIKHNDLLSGVSHTLDLLCQDLKEYFPPKSGKINELPNDVEIV